MKIAEGKCPTDGLDTEEVTEPTVFHQLHAPSDGCILESDAIGIMSETNPSGIGSAAAPEAGTAALPQLGASPIQRWTGAPNPKSGQEAGLAKTRPPTYFSKTDAPQCGATVQPCLVSQCLRAFDALPNVPSDTSKESYRDHVQKSFYAGMYTHGGVSALRSSCAEHAESIKLFADLIRAVHPRQMFTSLVVLDGAQNSIHRDSRNACVPNLVIPLTRFSGGELFLEKPDGEPHTVGGRTVCGELISLNEGPVTFDARHVSHGGLPSPDRRVVLIAYCLRGAQRLKAEDRKVLTQLGFCVPTSEPVPQSLPRFSTGFPDLRPLGFRPQPVPDVLPALRCRRLLFIELCSGSAGLSAAFRTLGFQVLAIDHGGNRHQPLVPTLSLDLRHDSAWSFVERMVKSCATLLVHIAPPCGTASRAREVPLKKGHGPRPLRSELHPLGLPGLSESDQSRVESANHIYARAANFCLWLHRQTAEHGLHTHFCVENPRRSYMWLIPEFIKLQQHCLHLAYDVCMHGGDRDKHQMLWTSMPELQVLAVCCDRSHPHRPWGQTPSGSFATASETEYPTLFCARFAAAAAHAAGSLHILPSACDVTTASARTAAQTQPKVSKALVIIEEYHYQVTIPLPSASLPPVNEKNCLLHALGPAPPGSRVLRVNFEGGVLFPKRPRPGFDFLSQVAQSTSGKVVSLTCGVYRNPMQFARQAIILQHPFDMCRALPDPALGVLARTLIDGPVSVVKSRLKTILTWKQWKRELEGQEAALHEAMHPDVARVMDGKNLLLLQRIAESLEWPDGNLHQDLVQGFRLIGDEQPSGIFPVEPKPALASVDEFWERSLLVKHALWQKVAESPTDRLSQGLYEVTEGEREKGWLSSPKTWEELEVTFGPRWVPVRRFAVEQRGKLRPIDDLAENGVNGAFAACDKLTLRALDELVWSATFLMRSVMQRGEVRVKLSSGEEVIGPLNDFWKADPERSRPLLKTVDLKSAYKQLAVHPDHQAACVVTVKDPCSTDPLGPGQA